MIVSNLCENIVEMLLKFCNQRGGGQIEFGLACIPAVNFALNIGAEVPLITRLEFWQLPVIPGDAVAASRLSAQALHIHVRASIGHRVIKVISSPGAISRNAINVICPDRAPVGLQE